MTSRPRPTFRLSHTAAWAVLLVLFAGSEPRVTRGQAAPAQASGPADILTASPFDRLNLIDGTTVLVEPVSPRPLPPVETDGEARGRRKDANAPPEEGNVGRSREPSKVKVVKTDEEIEEASKITIHLLEGEVRDFKVKRASIKSVDYYEDLMLAEADRLSLAREYDRAFECCLRVRTRDPKWPGLDARVNKLLYNEGSGALLNGEGERGLRLLRELFAREPNFPGLTDKLAESYSGRAVRAFNLGLFALGRKILHDVDAFAPNHPLVRAARQQFVTRARQTFDSARNLQGAGRLDALTEALRVWPPTEGADAAYRKAFAEWPTLDVGVFDLPRAVGPWVHSRADERVSRLVYLATLARDDEESLKGERPGQLAAEVKAADLGRRVTVRVRPGVIWSDGSRPVSVVDLARALTDSTLPSSPRYHARWADLLERVETSGEDRLEIRLTRPVIKPGSWLLGPVGPAHGGPDGRVATPSGARDLVSDGPFTWSRPEKDRASLILPDSPGDGPRPRIRRIRETRYPSSATALGAFSRGEVAMLEHVPVDRVPGLSKDPEVKVGRYTRPSLHRIALDGRNPALRNRTLRRGLAYAIDRKTLLEETLLKRPADAVSLVSDGVLPRGNYADAPGVAPLSYNPNLARMLVAAARKEIGGPPITLKLEYPAQPEAQAVVPKLVEAFRLAGVTIEAVERPESELESELRDGRPFDLAYRIGRCVEPLDDLGPLITPAYDARPDSNPLASLASPRILQLLLLLERAPEFPTAKGIATQIDRESRDELPVIPLWQLEDHYAWRARLKGPGETADTLYQGVEAWEVEPWFAKDPW